MKELRSRERERVKESGARKVKKLGMLFGKNVFRGDVVTWQSRTCRGGCIVE